MYAVVEFVNVDGSSTGEVSVVPLIWLFKNQTKCYWPSKIANQQSFTTMIQDQTPPKKSWPSYGVKVQLKTTDYSEADLKVLELTSDTYESNETCRSFIQKNIDNDSDNSEDEIPPKKTKLIGSETISIEPEQNIRKESIVYQTDTSSSIQSSASRCIFNSSSENSFVEPEISDTTLLAADSFLLHNTEFESNIMKAITKISVTVDQNSIMLNEIYKKIFTREADELTPPPSLPERFPFTTLEEFIKFDELISDQTLWDYMLRRLAAVGGSSPENMVRRILKYLLSNEVAVLFNWKGRDKLSFEKLRTLKLISAILMKTYGRDFTEYKLANCVKDWLKFAKTRMTKQRST